MTPIEALMREWLASDDPGRRYHAASRLGLPLPESERPAPAASLSLWRAMEACPSYEKRPGCCAGAVCTFAWRRRWTTFAECSSCLKSRGIA